MKLRIISYSLLMLIIISSYTTIRLAPSILLMFNEDIKAQERDAMRLVWENGKKDGTISDDISYERFWDATHGGKPLPGWK